MIIRRSHGRRCAGGETLAGERNMTSGIDKRPVRLAMLGCGVVGSGVVSILREQADLLRQRTGLSFDIAHVVVRDPAKARGLPASTRLSTDAEAALSDPAVDIVVELIGGTTTAGEYLIRALRAGKSVVTANKSLLATRGPELFQMARDHGASIAFEASCAGGIPIINSMMHGLVANRIDTLVGIVNGTCNFILTKMTREGLDYGAALRQAQAAGFAEADPTLDVSGRDAAQKLALLASLAFNARVAEADIAVSGIDTLDPRDIRYAGELGYVIKLLAVARRQMNGSAATDRLSLSVAPTLVNKSDVLADVSGSFNAVSLYGSAVGHALFYGRGAGSLPTASAVVSDIVHTALGLTPLAFKKLSLLPVSSRPLALVPPEQRMSRFYLRLGAKDQPGVLAQVTRVLGDEGISIASILQHESGDSSSVPLVITTHLASEAAVRSAAGRIDALESITQPSVCLRIIDPPAEPVGG